MKFFPIPKGWLFSTDEEVKSRYWQEYQWRYFDSSDGKVFPIKELPSDAALQAHIRSLRRELGCPPRKSVTATRATERPRKNNLTL